MSHLCIMQKSVMRGSEHPEGLLKGFSGYLQCDGYSAYGKYVREHEGLKALGCMAHARRKFKEAESEGQAPLNILQQIAKLYGIEKRLREDGNDAETIYAIRQRESLPLLEEFYSMVVSCERHSIDPSQYLSAVPEEAPHLVNRDQSHLTPRNWAKVKQAQAA